MTGEGFKTFGEILKQIDGFVWGVPLIVLIILTGIYLTIRVRGDVYKRQVQTLCLSRNRLSNV